MSEKGEGELYRKMRNYEYNRPHDDFGGYSEDGGNEKKLFKILDEAKQDFPDWHNPRGIGKTFTAFENEVIDWFKKWFGEVKEK